MQRKSKKKTENLTTQEAWAAMARGECVKAAKEEFFHIFNSRVLKYWNGYHWVNTSVLAEGPYSIVPDPSKPKEAEMSEYQKERVKVVEAPSYRTLEEERAALICFIEQHFQRKL